MQDPLSEAFAMPLISQENARDKAMLSTIEQEISAYGETSSIGNETFQLFSQSDLPGDHSAPVKKVNRSSASATSAFNHIQTKTKSLEPTANKFTASLQATNVAQHRSTDLEIEQVMSNIDNDEFFASW
jgi:hypothetical protein